MADKEEFQLLVQFQNTVTTYNANTYKKTINVGGNM